MKASRTGVQKPKSEASRGRAKTGMLSARGTGLLLLIGVCAFVVLYFQRTFWAGSVDVAHHYALIAHMQASRQLPSPADRSLGEMSVYPRFAHILAAIAGTALGSPLTGMQLVGLLSLTCLWAVIALMLSSLPLRPLLRFSGAAAILLAVEGFALHLELFGNELTGSYFFAQSVAQAVAIGVIAAALLMDRAGRPAELSYLVLGCSVPIVLQIHALPALELMAFLMLVVMLDVLRARGENRWRAFRFGVLITLTSFAITALNPQFAIMARLSENNGLLSLKYTPDARGLALEAVVVATLSAFLVWQWLRAKGEEARRGGLILKYWGLFGLAVAALCLLQIAMLPLGLGSTYACKKYAFGLNTVLFLGVLLLVVRPQSLVPSEAKQRYGGRLAATFQLSFPALFALAACFALLPPVSEGFPMAYVMRVEQLALEYRDPHPGYSAGNYDYAMGLFSTNSSLDYMISIGALGAPRDRNTDAIILQIPPSKPGEVGRILTRQDAVPWDVPACRLVLTADGFAILDGRCVLKQVAPSK